MTYALTTRQGKPAIAITTDAPQFGRTGETVTADGVDHELGAYLGRFDREHGNYGPEVPVYWLYAVAQAPAPTPEPAEEPQAEAAPDIIFRRAGGGWEIDSDTALTYGQTVRVARRDGTAAEQRVGTEQPAADGRYRYSILADEQAEETLAGGRIDRKAMQRIAATGRYARPRAFGAWDDEDPDAL